MRRPLPNLPVLENVFYRVSTAIVNLLRTAERWGTYTRVPAPCPAGTRSLTGMSLRIRSV
jgi:hypothetical protein